MEIQALTYLKFLILYFKTRYRSYFCIRYMRDLNFCKTPGIKMDIDLILRLLTGILDLNLRHRLKTLLRLRILLRGNFVREIWSGEILQGKKMPVTPATWLYRFSLCLSHAGSLCMYVCRSVWYQKFWFMIPN